MLIHNVHSDLLTSITYFLNNYIFNHHHIKIKYFQYNIGNSSFQLDYKTQEELPSAIVTLQTITPFINKPYVFHRNMMNNIHKIPVLYDRTKDIELLLQEEMYTIAVTININCDSQLQALEAQHRLMNYLPLNKYLQAYRYTSFFEIDPNFLSKYLIDVSKDKIENLFYKQNKYTDTFDYCFSVEYEPLIRLNSCDIGIDSSVNSSFQVSCSFEFLTHLPIYIEAPNINWNNPVSYNHLQYNNIPVPIYDDKVYLLVELKNTKTFNIHKEIWDFNNSKVSGKIDYYEKIYSVSTLIGKVKIDAILHIFEDESHNTIHEKCFIEGNIINGLVRQVNFISDDVVTFYFMGTINGTSSDQYLTFEYQLNDILAFASNIILRPDLDHEVIFYKLLPNKINVLNSITNINRSAVKINPSKTYVTKYIDINNNPVILNPPVFINEFTNEFILPDNTVGYLDVDTFKLSLDHPDIQYIYLNLSFDYVKGIPGNIERINYNFNTTNQIIVNNSPYSILPNFNYNVISLISHIEYDESTSQITIDLNFTSTIIDFIFVDNNQNILNYNHLSIISNSPKLIIQLVSPTIYWKYFSNISILTPIYFCYNLEEF